MFRALAAAAAAAAPNVTANLKVRTLWHLRYADALPLSSNRACPERALSSSRTRSPAGDVSMLHCVRARPDGLQHQVTRA